MLLQHLQREPLQLSDQRHVFAVNAHPIQQPMHIVAGFPSGARQSAADHHQTDDERQKEHIPAHIHRHMPDVLRRIALQLESGIHADHIVPESGQYARHNGHREQLIVQAAHLRDAIVDAGHSLYAQRTFVARLADGDGTQMAVHQPQTVEQRAHPERIRTHHNRVRCVGIHEHETAGDEIVEGRIDAGEEHLRGDGNHQQFYGAHECASSDDVAPVQ